MSQTIEQTVAEIIRPAVEAAGYDLVRVKLMEGKRRTLQIMAERKDEQMMNVDDCETISHTVSAILDVHEPVSGAYHLEVSSPGIDRPLINRRDFERYAGYEVKVETILPQEGRRRFKGVLEELQQDEFVVRLDAKNAATIPLSNVAEAKLVLTDQLIREHLKQQEQSETNTLEQEQK